MHHDSPLHPGHRALLVCLIVLAAASSAADDFDSDVDQGLITRATFVLKTGETIADAPFVVDERFHTVALRMGDGERNVSFADIAAIRAGDRDVTDIVLGRFAGDAEAVAAESWLSANDPTYVKRAPPPWRLGLRLAGNTSIPVGDYYDGIDSDFGYEGDFLIGLRRTYGLRLSVSRAGLAVDDDVTLVNLDPYLYPDNQDWSVTAWRFSVAAQVQTPLTHRAGDLSLLYAYGGMGAIWQELACDFDLVDSRDDSRVPSHRSYDETKFLTTLGGGVMQMVSPAVGIDLAAEMDVVWIGTADDDVSNYYGSPRTSMLIDFKLGVVILFD